MNHYSAMANLSKVRHELGDDVWTYLLNSSIGVFADLEFTWAAEIAHYFLVNQLLVDDMHEILSLIDDQPFRFSLHEFAALPVSIAIQSKHLMFVLLGTKSFGWRWEYQLQHD
ncbi:hypothetical protein V5N11_029793 [Cardamine amara subsp. amara]|uniref:Uncharacterized protein n=1 Tax=Cardamine amara subsp. amara TaxID=228776 RepID=A0ABD1C2P6_CARAN